MISNDTGPLHLAAAAGARVIGIYTCTNPLLTGPFGPRDHGSDRHLVQVQLAENMPTDGVHARTDTRPRVAGGTEANRIGDVSSRVGRWEACWSRFLSRSLRVEDP